MSFIKLTGNVWVAVDKIAAVRDDDGNTAVILVSGDTFITRENVQGFVTRAASA